MSTPSRRPSTTSRRRSATSAVMPAPPTSCPRSPTASPRWCRPSTVSWPAPATSSPTARSALPPPPPADPPLTPTGHAGGMIRSDDRGRVRLLTLDRPDKLNAFNDALYDATAAALRDAAADPGVAVVVITGEGRAFSTGTDVTEMSALASGDSSGEAHGFPGLVDAL